MAAWGWEPTFSNQAACVGLPCLPLTTCADVGFLSFLICKVRVLIVPMYSGYLLPHSNPSQNWWFKASVYYSLSEFCGLSGISWVSLHGKSHGVTVTCWLGLESTEGSTGLACARWRLHLHSWHLGGVDVTAGGWPGILSLGLAWASCLHSHLRGVWPLTWQLASPRAGVLRQKTKMCIMWFPVYSSGQSCVMPAQIQREGTNNTPLNERSIKEFVLLWPFYSATLFNGFVVGIE